MRTLLFAALLVCAIAQPTITSDWMNVNTGFASSPDAATAVLPHAASFSDGRYIIVYTIQTEDSISRVCAQIYNANHTIAVPQFDLEPDASPINQFSSPNVAVFPDDSFMITYRWDSGDPTSITSRFYLADYTEAGVPFRVDQNVAGVSMRGDVKLIGFSDYGYAVFYFTESPGCNYVVVRDESNRLVLSACIYDAVTEPVASSVIADSLGSTSYVVTETQTNQLNAGLVSQTSFGFTTTTTLTPQFTNPAIALGGDSVVTVLHNAFNSTYYTVTNSYFSSNSRGNIVTEDGVNIYTAHSVLALAARKVLLGYRSYNTSDGTSILTYQTGDIDYNQLEALDLVLNPDQYSFSTNVYAFQFIPLSGSDILVLGKENVMGDIMRQIITFCGNGVQDLDEECDGTLNCNEFCRCPDGLYGFEGVCSLPNVMPTLDCVETGGEGYYLFFSFVNQDRVGHYLPHGAINSFYPTTYASDRPTEFPVGPTLTYPASYYTLLVDFTVTEINWLLGSYNLTVNLTNVNALKCPETPSFVVEVTTPTFIPDDNGIALNFAERYSISPERVSSSVSQTGGDVPAKKRSLNFYQNRFAVSINVVPANETVAPQERTSAEAVRTVIEEFKDEDSRQEVQTDLLDGYAEDEDTTVKEITPNPTGVEVRGVRHDSSNTLPPSASPSSPSNEPQSSTPSSTPMSNNNVSSSNVLLPTLTVFLTAALFV